MKKYLSTIIRGAILLSLVISLIVISILKNNPEICENTSRGFARFISFINSKISSGFPFSLTELSFVLLALGILALFVETIIHLKHKMWQASINRVIEGAAIILLSLNLYDLSCEFAYKRKEMPLPYYQNEIAREDHVTIFNYFADDVNNCISMLEFKESGEVKNKMSLNELTKEIKKAYSIITDSYFSKHFGSVKPMASSFVYRELQITGVTYSPLSEANINILNTATNLPLTIAHELAHTKGVMREDDANKLAFYVCLNSEHPYLRYSAYSAYFSQMEAIVSSTYLTEEMREGLHNEYKAALNKTRSYEYQFWKKHDLLGKIGDFINDLYIKNSGVKEGTNSYSGGTQYEYDPLTQKFYPSLYQKLFFEKYYRLSI